MDSKVSTDDWVERVGWSDVMDRQDTSNPACELLTDREMRTLWCKHGQLGCCGSTDLLSQK